MKSNLKNNEISCYLAALGGAFVMFIFQYVADKCRMGSIPMYLASCVLFLAVFGMVYLLSEKSFRKQSKREMPSEGESADCGYAENLAQGVNQCEKLTGKVGGKTTEKFAWIGFAILILLVLGWMCITYKYEIKEYSYYTCNYNRHILSEYIWFPMLLIGSFLLFSFAKSASFSKLTSKILRFTVSAGFVLLQGRCLYHPNLFRGGEGTSDLFHLDSYVSAIINVCNGASYSPHLGAYYGHYGFFYYPLVKILNLFMNQWFAASMAISIVGAFMFIFFYMLLNKLVKNDIVFILAVAASGMLTFEMIGHQMYEVYYQVLPHRMLLQVMGLYFFYIVIRNNTQSNRILLWVVSTLGLIWNLESGIVLLIVWVLLDLYLKYRGKKWKQMLHVILMLPLSFIAAYVLLNILNLIWNGDWLSFGCFAYPFTANSECSFIIYCKKYLWILVVFLIVALVLPRISKKENKYKYIFLVFISVLGVGTLLTSKEFLTYVKSGSFFNATYSAFTPTYQGPFSGGYCIALLFLVIFAIGLFDFWRRNFARKELSENDLVEKNSSELVDENWLFLVFCSILGLGCLTYHYEHSVSFSLIMIMPEAVALMAGLIDGYLKHYNMNGLKQDYERKSTNNQTQKIINQRRWYHLNPFFQLKGISISIIMIFLSCMAIESLFSLPTKWNRESQGVWVTEGSDEFVSRLDAVLPSGTMCYGVGVPLLCAYMDRDPLLHVQECSNPTPEGNKYLEDEINSGKYEYIFTTLNESIIVENEYELVESFDYMDRGEFLFGLYRRK